MSRAEAKESEMRRVVRCLPANDTRYRYLLEIALRAPPSPRLTVMMKNPSTASETRSDPTIGKVEAWARRHGFGLVTVVNLFALRATTPAQLNDVPYSEAVGSENGQFIQAATAEADLFVVAWGEPNGIHDDAYNRRVREALALLAGVPQHAVGPPTRRGYPRHGLRWNAGCALLPWPATTSCGGEPMGRRRVLNDSYHTDRKTP